MHINFHNEKHLFVSTSDAQKKKNIELSNIPFSLLIIAILVNRLIQCFFIKVGEMGIKSEMGRKRVKWA